MPAAILGAVVLGAARFAALVSDHVPSVIAVTDPAVIVPVVIAASTFGTLMAMTRSNEKSITATREGTEKQITELRRQHDESMADVRRSVGESETRLRNMLQPIVSNLDILKLDLTEHIAEHRGAQRARTDAANHGEN